MNNPFQKTLPCEVSRFACVAFCYSSENSIAESSIITSASGIRTVNVGMVILD